MASPSTKLDIDIELDALITCVHQLLSIRTHDGKLRVLRCLLTLAQIKKDLL